MATPEAPATHERLRGAERRPTLRHLALQLRWRGVESDEIERVLIEENRRQCSPPLSVAAVRRLAASAALRPTFDEAFGRLSRAWSKRAAGRKERSEWKTRQALLLHVERARSFIVAPGIRRLAEDAHLGTQAVQRALKRLIDAGDLEPLAEQTRGLATRYVVRPPKSASLKGPFDVLDELWPYERLAFVGRENALWLSHELDGERASTVKGLADITELHPSTIRSNLRWLEEHRRARREGTSWYLLEDEDYAVWLNGMIFDRAGVDAWRKRREGGSDGEG